MSGAPVRVVKRKVSPPPSKGLVEDEESDHKAQIQACETVEPVFASPMKPIKRRLSALGGPARVRTPSKSKQVEVAEKENVDIGDNTTASVSVFRFPVENKNDGNASDEYSRDSLDSAGRRASSCAASDRRSSTSSHDSGSSLSSGDDIVDRPWCSKDFSIGKAIGKGKFGNVYLAKVKKNRATVALKVLFKAPMRAANCVHSLRREVEIQCRLKHKNITQLFGYFHDSKNVYLILEYLQHGELFKYIDKQGGRVDEITCRGFMRDIVSAVSYLHARNVIHRGKGISSYYILLEICIVLISLFLLLLILADLKPENILFDMVDDKMNLRIADFGCAVVMSPAEGAMNSGVLEKQRTVCGTPEYLAPEMLLEIGHGLEVDLWALGIFIYEILAGK